MWGLEPVRLAQRTAARVEPLPCHPGNMPWHKQYLYLAWGAPSNPADGIKSAFIATLNAGLSGLTLTHSDIG